MEAFGHLATGDVKSAHKSSETAIEVALDPVYAQFPKGTLAFAHFFGGQFEEAEKVLQSILNFTEKRGVGQITAATQVFMAPILIAKGQMQPGIKLMEDVQNTLLENQRRVFYAISEYILGEVNLQIATGPKPSLTIMAKNIGFLVRNVPFAAQKAEEHYQNAMEMFKEIGMKSYLGQVYLGLGLLYKARKKADRAKQCLSDAINILRECKAEAYLKQANEALDSLK
jgi:tetratricopeptide (TPR) repeat protein